MRWLRLVSFWALLMLIACGATFAGGDEDLDQDPPSNEVMIESSSSLPEWTNLEECKAALIARAVHRDGKPVVFGGAQYSLRTPGGPVASLRFVPSIICQRLMVQQTQDPVIRAIINDSLMRRLEQLLRDLDR